MNVQENGWRSFEGTGHTKTSGIFAVVAAVLTAAAGGSCCSTKDKKPFYKTWEETSKASKPRVGRTERSWPGELRNRERKREKAGGKGG